MWIFNYVGLVRKPLNSAFDLKFVRIPFIYMIPHVFFTGFRHKKYIRSWADPREELTTNSDTYQRIVSNLCLRSGEHALSRDFPDHATFREKGAKLACADKLGVFFLFDPM